ncbi:MAG: glycosyltransferase [Verrucomicrobiota bacterium]|jgi:glycosyltransferase involved in cell wall biosynthesis
MNKPTITVCVPVYNTAKYIKQCIESVFAQEFKDWVLLVSDNCSTDGTWELLQQFQHPRMRLFRKPQNLGGVANFNFLLEKAETDFVCFLGSDDYFYPNHLGNKVRLLEQFPEAPFVHGAVRFADSEGNERPGDDFKCATIEERKETSTRFLKVNFVNITSAVLRTAAMRRHNLGFESRYLLMIDWALFLKLALLEGPLIYDEQPTAVYRIHPQSIARKAIPTFDWPYEAMRVRMDALTEYPATWREIGLDPLAEARSLTKPLWRLAFQQARRGNFTNAKQAWRFYREFYSPLDAFCDFPRYLRDGLRKGIKTKPSN